MNKIFRWKKLAGAITGMLMLMTAQAQFTKANLQATGLTCAMCSNAINKALLAKSFIQSVKPDIRHSSFEIIFKEDADVDIDGIRKAVEDAGFGIGSLQLTGNFNAVEIGNDKHVKLGDKDFHFLHVEGQVLNGEHTIRIIDKDFLTAKQFKKFSEETKMKCLQTGKSGSCCPGVAAGTRIYHATI